MNRVTPPAASSSADELDNPRRIGPYRLLDELGEGGMGVVFRAIHVESGDRVALKTTRTFDSRAIAGLRREARILAELDHPGVVSLIDRGTASGTPWLAIELLDGENVRDRLDEAVPAPESEFDLGSPPSSTELTEDALRSTADFSSTPHDSPTPSRAFEADRIRPLLVTMRRLCGVLEHLHRHGIVHRDLKPSNIFLRADGQPVLVDFGLAVHASSIDRRDRLEPGARARAGTVHYMAPEQLRGEPLDSRADLYALGCMLYLTVTGRHPFAARSVHESVRRHLMGLYTPADRLVEGLPRPLCELIDGLLISDPDRRILHVNYVEKRLNELLGTRGARTPSQEPATSSGAPLHPRRLVGREETLAQILDDLPTRGHRSGAPTPSLALIEGHCGAGKTRLASEFAARARDRGAHVSVASSEPILSDVGAQHARPLWAFQPTLRLIADYCREMGADASKRILGARARVLRRFEPSLDDLPGLQQLDDPVELPARSARSRVLTYLTETLSAFAANRPLVIVIDDLHRADELSLDAIERIVDADLDGVFVVGAVQSTGRGRLVALS
ncbi:MAG: serine/threonine protein kinase, partial [Persicimonas sp.]